MGNVANVGNVGGHVKSGAQISLIANMSSVLVDVVYNIPLLFPLAYRRDDGTHRLPCLVRFLPYLAIAEGVQLEVSGAQVDFVNIPTRTPMWALSTRGEANESKGNCPLGLSFYRGCNQSGGRVASKIIGTFQPKSSKLFQKTGTFGRDCNSRFGCDCCTALFCVHERDPVVHPPAKGRSIPGKRLTNGLSRLSRWRPTRFRLLLRTHAPTPRVGSNCFTCELARYQPTSSAGGVPTSGGTPLDCWCATCHAVRLFTRWAA